MLSALTTFGIEKQAEKLPSRAYDLHAHAAHTHHTIIKPHAVQTQDKIIKQRCKVETMQLSKTNGRPSNAGNHLNPHKQATCLQLGSRNVNVMLNIQGLPNKSLAAYTFSFLFGTRVLNT